MRSRGKKARGYDTHKTERNYLSDEKPHKKPVREDKKKVNQIFMGDE